MFTYPIHYSKRSLLSLNSTNFVFDFIRFNITDNLYFWDTFLRRTGTKDWVFIELKSYVLFHKFFKIQLNNIIKKLINVFWAIVYVILTKLAFIV